MKTLFRKENLKKTILSLVYLVFGVMFCVMPTKMFNFVESALCFVLLIVGIVGILVYSVLSAEDKEVKILLWGIVGLALSICMFLEQRLFGIILSLIIGLGGVGMIISGLKLKKAKNIQWVTDFVIGVVVTALAVATIVLSGTKVAENIIAVFFGIMCLINGIYSIVELILLVKKESKQANEKPADEKETEEQTTEETHEEKLEKVEQSKAEEKKVQEPKEEKPKAKEKKK